MTLFRKSTPMQLISVPARSLLVTFLSGLILVCLLTRRTQAGELLAGVSKVDITRLDAGPVHGRLHVRALVLRNSQTTAVIVTVDAVAIGEIGYIGNDYLATVRARLQDELGIEPTNVMINASHCHGVPSRDTDERTIQAVMQAAENLVPVKIGVGRGHEDRIMENRRLKLKNGREIDVRHAYSMPRDEDVADVGPVDPEIGVLRVNRTDGRTLAVVYNFACHPIQGVASGANTADITGFSSEVIEDNLDAGTVALFVQGCGGDINPVYYKDVNLPRDAEPLGNLLGLSTLKAVRRIQCEPDERLAVLNQVIALPRADYAERIAVMEEEQLTLLQSLRGTTLNFKSFLPLAVKYGMFEDYPSYYSHHYLHENKLGRRHLAKMDSDNRRAMRLYLDNIQIMEQLTRNQTNLTLLRRHQKQLIASGSRTLNVELVAIRIGDFVMLTFPGELTVRIGLNLKSASPHKDTFIAGYTNGYIYYSPTAEQLRNVGGAQEDSDCMLAPEWQEIFETRAIAMLKQL